jgi:hypothetical protein
MSDVFLSFWPVVFFVISLYSVTLLLNMFLFLDTSVHDLFSQLFIPLQDSFSLCLLFGPYSRVGYSSMYHFSIVPYSLISLSRLVLTVRHLFNTGLCPLRYPFKIVLLCFIRESANGTGNKSYEHDSLRPLPYCT